MDYKNIYLKSFVFKAENFEEYHDGICTHKGLCDTTIIANVFNPKGIGIRLQDSIPTQINERFDLPIFGISLGGDILADRIQYGRIPGSFSWHDSNEPVVCEIFNNMTCIRFAMMSPLRIVEFNGRFTQIQ